MATQVIPVKKKKKKLALWNAESIQGRIFILTQTDFSELY